MKSIQAKKRRVTFRILQGALSTVAALLIPILNIFASLFAVRWYSTSPMLGPRSHALASLATPTVATPPTRVVNNFIQGACGVYLFYCWGAAERNLLGFLSLEKVALL